MKKGFLLAIMLLVTSSVFCATFDNSEKIVENFWNKGTYIKIIKDSNNICYYYKENVAGLIIDENDMEIYPMGFDPWTGKTGSVVSFNISRWVFSSDENGNIIITKK